MARPLRIEYPGAFYHVTCRGNERRPIVKDDPDRKAFLDRLQTSLEHYAVVLHAYVLMDNHFHLIVETPRGNLSEFMRRFNVAYTGYFNRRHRRVGHLYQGRFKAIAIEVDSYLLELSRYVHLNPVRVAGWKDRSVQEKGKYLQRYRWSSLGGYLREGQREAFVEYERVLGYLGGNHQQGRAAYAMFVEEGIMKGMDSPWEKVTGQVLLGNEGFVNRMRGRLEEDRASVREQPSRRALLKRWDAEELIRRVARVVEKPIADLCARGGGVERAIVMECLHRHAQMSQRKIGERMGGVDYSWVSRMRSELRHRIQRDAGVKKLFQSVEAVLTQE